MAELHRLLRRQIRAYLGDEEHLPEEVRNFIQAVSGAYHQSDADRLLLERSLDLSSRELLQVNADLRAVVQAFPDLFLWLFPDGGVLGCRASSADDLYFPLEQLVGKNVTRIPAPGVGERFAGALEDIRRGARLVTIEYALELAGSPRDYEARLLPLGGGQVLAIVRNISARKRVERELEHSLALLQATLDNTGAGLMVVDNQRRVVTVNRQFADFAGVPRQELEAADQPTRAAFFRRLLKDPDRVFEWAEATYETPDESRTDLVEFRDGRCFETTTRPFHAGGDVAGRVWSMTDVSERVAAERALRASEERYRLLFESNPQPMWVYDRDSQAFLAVNEAAIRHYGYTRSDFLSMTVEGIRPRSDPRSANEPVRGERPEAAQGGETTHQRKDGTILTVEETSHELVFANRRAALVLVHDVTGRKKLEAQLRHSQKMEAVGRLAGGVAHDFNNILTAITGFGQILRRTLGAGSPNAHHISEILRAATRAATLTRQLLAFGRQQVLEPRITSLDTIVSELHAMLARLIGEDIHMVLDLRADAARVVVDPGQLEQVIVNLVVNARDAMPQGGRLTIATRVEAAEAVRREPGESATGKHVVLSVSDTGVGMDRETQSKAFEPFFTTKPSGKGTGLGLATVYGIVEQSGGAIRLTSEVGIGACFEILLPEVSSGGALEPPPPTPGSVPPGQGTILLVEDDDAVRSLVNVVLEHEGYTVLTADGGRQALEVARRYDGPIRLLLTDVVMPSMSGPDLADRLKSARPDLRVLLMSGYTGDALDRHGALGSSFSILTKPFRPDELASKVHEILSDEKRLAA